MMRRRNKGLAEELSRLFYNRSGPTLRAVQRRISQPGVWWKVAQVLGLVVGGLIVVVSGTLPWWELGYLEANGLDLLRGRAAFSLGLLLVLLGFMHAVHRSERIRIGSVVAGCAISVAVVALALLEWSQYANFSWERPLNSLSGPHYLGQSAVREGLRLTLYGGIIASFGSLCGLVRDPDPAADPPPRFPQYVR